jgi:hypothetical protein
VAIVAETAEAELHKQIDLLKAKLKQKQRKSCAKVPQEPENNSLEESCPGLDKPSKFYQNKSKCEDHEMRLSNQITSKSYLGKAFGELGSKPTKKHTSLNDPSSDKPSNSSSSNEDDLESSSSPSDSSGTSSDSNLLQSSNDKSHKLQHKYAKKKKASKKKKSVVQSLIKPAVPDKYNGAADTQIFHCFLTQGTAYVIDGLVAEK